MPEADAGTSLNNGPLEAVAAGEETRRKFAAPASMPNRRSPRLEKVIEPILIVCPFASGVDKGTAPEAAALPHEPGSPASGLAGVEEKTHRAELGPFRVEVKAH